MTAPSRLRLVLAGTAAAAILGALVWALLPAPVLVDLAEARRGPMQVTVSAEGTTRIRDLWRVTAPVTGDVLRSPVQIGDAVTGGETVVAVIEPAEPPFLDARARRLAEAAVAEAEAAVRLATAKLLRAGTELSYLETELARYRKLAERGTVPETTLENAEQAVRTARAARDVAQSDLDMQRASLRRMEAQLLGPDTEAAPSDCCVRLTAPQTGTVLELVDENARLVQAGDPLLTIGDPADLEIRVDLLSSDAVGVTRGTRAIVDRWGGPRPLDAEVRQIEPSAFTRISALGIEEQRVPLVLDILTPPEARTGLGDQYRVYVTLVTWSGENVLRVPQSALFRDSGRWALFVAQDGRARQRFVEVGRMSGEWAQILTGVESGERVVAYPGSAIEEGTRLEARTGQDDAG